MQSEMEQASKNYPSSCMIRDWATDPNGARFKTFGQLANYSKFECTSEPFDANKFLVMGSRNPPCDLAKPYMIVCDTDTIQYQQKCSDYAGYNRNGRFKGSIYDPKPFKTENIHLLDNFY
jgi:hypothetical protein